MPSNLCMPRKTQLMYLVIAATWNKTMHSAGHSYRAWTRSMGHDMENQGVPASALAVSHGEQRYKLRCRRPGSFGFEEKFSCQLKKFYTQGGLWLFTATANTNKGRASLQNELC